MDNEQWKPDVIVLGPAGIKVFLELGALVCAERMGWLKNIKWYVGVSAGAIISYLLILGYTVSEAIMVCLKFNILPDIRQLDFDKMTKEWGIFSQQELQNVLRECALHKFGIVPTMEQLYQATGIDFTVVTVNLDERGLINSKAVYIDRRSHPDMSSVTAISLSSNIPLIFYRMKHEKDLYIDGMFGNPYPVDICDIDDNRVLGIGVTSNDSKQYSGDDRTILHYIDQFLTVTVNELRSRIISQSSDRCRHLLISDGTIDPLGLTTPKENRIDMIVRGYDEATNRLVNI